MARGSGDWQVAIYTFKLVGKEAKIITHGQERVLSLIFLFLKYKKKEKKKNYPPGPKGLPIIGNLHQLESSAPHIHLSKLGKIYGPILSLKLGRRRAVVIQSATLAKEVLKTQDNNFCNRPLLTGQMRLSYNGSDLGFAPFDDHYREMRKISVVHLLSSKKVLSSAPIRREEVSRMIQNVSSLSSASKLVNMNELLMTLTSSVICRVAIGKRYKEEDVERSRFHKLLNELQAMLSVFYYSDYVPIIGGLIDKIKGSSSRLEKIFKEMDEFYDEIINDHLDPNRHKDDHDDHDHHEDIVDVLLHLRKERCFSFELSLDHIKALLMDIIAAGTDTSSAMVVWTMTELMKNPTVMNKVQAEIRTLNRDKTFIEEDDLPKLTYFKAVVKEALRIHPATPMLIFRESMEKCCLQEYDIEPKTLVLVNVWAIGRDPEFWKDPHVFMPERFLDSSVDYKGQNFEFIPFGAGKRVCPGMLIGVANVELSLANLLHFFDWELPLGVNKDDIDTHVIPGITVHKKNPLCLVANKVS